MKKRRVLPNHPIEPITTAPKEVTKAVLTRIHKISILQSRLIRELKMAPHNRRLNPLFDLVLDEAAHNQRDLQNARSYTQTKKNHAKPEQPLDGAASSHPIYI